MDVVIDQTGDEHVGEANTTDVYTDLFQSTFGNTSGQKDDESNDNDDIEDDTAMHAEGCNLSNRMSTPPPPTTKFASDPARKTKNTIPGKLDTKEDGRKLKGADVDRDLSIALRNHHRFHDRVLNLIPRLHAPDFDWSRRYWIAVLMLGKKAKNAVSEKDFIWMKGNRLSTGKTIWHRYMESDFNPEVDEKTTVLMLGNERLGDMDTMEEVDLFNDRFVLLRAVNKGAPDDQTKSPIHGLIPAEAWPSYVVDLD